MLENITQSTLVNFVGGAIKSKGRILSILKLNNNKLGVIADRTCFHPVDYRWPDQPGDKGKIIIEQNKEIPVEDSFIAAINRETKNCVYEQVDFKKIKAIEDYYFVVTHVVENKFEKELEKQFKTQSNIELFVDQAYRRKISSSHTACHLAALALNKATMAFWEKDKGVKKDSLGNLDFDKTCIESSEIFPDKSVDKYRLGKSMKKKGFNTNRFFTNLSKIEVEVNGQLNKWIEISKTKELKSKVLPEESLLPERREWQCQLPEGKAAIPCGGTHITDLNNFKAIQVKIESKKAEDADYVVMNTIALTN